MKETSATTATSAPSILLVDDDEVFRERLARALRARGHEVATAADAEAAQAAARGQAFGYGVVDLRMPGASGLELVAALKRHDPAMRIVVLTGYGSIVSAVEAMRLGAHNYLSKPADADDVLAALAGAQAAAGAGGEAREAPPPSLARAEWEHIQRILADCNGNVSETARRLGITRRTLQLKLKKYPPRV
jgi:two-component system response regulator RegA